jgi:hypothetical protein
MEPKSSGNPPGEVVTITWADKGTSQVRINAKDVTTAGTWHATYSWDGNDKVLTLNKPSMGAKPATSKPPHSSGSGSYGESGTTTTTDIKKLVIETWGSSEVKPALEWTGPTAGTATIVFQDAPHTSGPVGGVDGP